MQTEMERGLTPPPQTTLELRVPEKNEKLGAAAVHVGDIFFPIIFPLGAMLFTRKKSDYVYSHARQSIIETLWLNIFLGIAIITSLYFTFSGLWQHYQEGWVNWDWQEQAIKLGVKALISWILMAILGFINTVTAVLQAIKALQGEWPKSWKKKMAKV